MGSYRKFNVAKPRKEILKTGEEKTFWDNMGTAVIFTKEDGSQQGIIELHTLDKEIKLNMFPVKIKERENFKNEDGYTNENNTSQVQTDEYFGDGEPKTEKEIKVENIPF